MPKEKIPGGYTWLTRNENCYDNKYLIAIDPGKKNSGFRIEWFSIRKNRVKSIVSDLPCFFSAKSTTTLDDKTCANIGRYINSKHSYIKKCRAVLIERQVNKNGGAREIAYAIVAYLMGKYGKDSPEILFVNPMLKGSKLFKPKWVTGKYRLKRWSECIAAVLCSLYGDNPHKVIGDRKADDVSDCVLMCEVFRVYVLGMKPFIEEDLIGDEVITLKWKNFVLPEECYELEEK